MGAFGIECLPPIHSVPYILHKKDKKMKKRTIEIKLNQPEAPVSRSEVKENFKNLIEAYKIQNPVKYAEKEARLLAKLANL